MAGVIRIRSVGKSRRRAGLAFSREWSPLDGAQVNEAQLLAILEDKELELEFAASEQPGVDPEFVPYPHREEAIAVLREHIAYDIAHGRPHDMLAGRESSGTDADQLGGISHDDFTKFQSALGAEDRMETGAPGSGASEAKDGTGTDDNAAPSADPQGGEPASAAGAQESREGTEDGATAQEAPPSEEKQPQDSLQPAVAETTSSGSGTASPDRKRRRAVS